MKNHLTRAIELAARAHDTQLDKSRQPYILHPLRVMLRVTGYTAKVIAVLHDVVEDTAIDMNNLEAMHFPREVLDGVDLLTRKDNETYFDYIRRIKASDNPLAVSVKLADLADNMDPIRSRGIPPKQYESLCTRYAAAVRILLSWKGNK